MAGNPISYGKGKVQPNVVFVRRVQPVHNTQALQFVAKFEFHRGRDPLQYLLALVAKRSVPEVMPDRDSLHQMLVQAHRLSDRGRYGGNVKAVLQASAKMVVPGRDKDLRLVPHPPESPRMDDSRVVPLEFRSEIVRPLGILP
jgi:hypothetical protein